METAETVYTRMREGELIARIRYHEDRLREAERLAVFHRSAGEAADAELNALRKHAGARPRLTAARWRGSDIAHWCSRRNTATPREE